MDFTSWYPIRTSCHWKLWLQELDFEVVYRPGIKHNAPDGLFRLDTNGQDDSDIEHEIPVLALTKSDTKAIDTLKEDDQASQEGATYPDL